MIYVKEENGAATKISLRQFCKDNKHISFPKKYTPQAFEPCGVFEVEEAVKPAHNKKTQRIEDSFTKPADVWVQKWTVVAKDAGEIMEHEDGIILNRAQFTYFKSISDLMPAWDAVIASEKNRDPILCATMLAQHAKDDYSFDELMLWMLDLEAELKREYPQFKRGRSDLLPHWEAASELDV